MKKFVLYALIFLSLIASTVFAQPKLEIVGGDTYNWGEIRGNKNVLKAKVQLKNAGTDTLIINNVKATCGCTTAPLDKKELGPGEIGTLDITLRIAGRSNNVSKTIRIKSNDKSTPEKVLWLKCTIIRDLQITQSYLSFQEMTVGYDKEAKISIKNNSKEIIKLSDFAIEPANLKINLKGMVNIKPGKKIDLKATLTPETPGNFKGSVKFKTTNKDNKEVTIKAFGRVKKSPIFNNTK